MADLHKRMYCPTDRHVKVLIMHYIQFLAASVSTLTSHHDLRNILTGLRALIAKL